MTKKKATNKPIDEGIKMNYRLRSTFFYRKLIEYNTFKLPIIIKELISSSQNYDWNDYEKWGISPLAFGQIQQTQLNSIQVFLHPQLIREYPSTLSYYRNLAVLSQKSVAALLGVSTDKQVKIENGTLTDISESDALKFCKLFNEHISLIVESALETLDEGKIHGIICASTGAQINSTMSHYPRYALHYSHSDSLKFD